MRVETSWRPQLLLNLYGNFVLWCPDLSTVLKSGQISVDHVVLKISLSFSTGLILVSIFSDISSFISICICLSNCILNSGHQK